VAIPGLLVLAEGDLPSGRYRLQDIAPAVEQGPVVEATVS
jgi:hypothetical protein